jgi:hypothetical protein
VDRQSSDRVVDVGQVGSVAAPRLRSPDADEVHVRIGDGREVRGEPEPAGLDVLAHQRL